MNIYEKSDSIFKFNYCKIIYNPFLLILPKLYRITLDEIIVMYVKMIYEIVDKTLTKLFPDIFFDLEIVRDLTQINAIHFEILDSYNVIPEEKILLFYNEVIKELDKIPDKPLSKFTQNKGRNNYESFKFI